MTKEQLTQAQDEKFNWVGRDQMFWSASTADVTINQVKGKRKGEDVRYSIIFRGKAHNAFKLSEGVQVAVFKNRVMFRESDKGFKLTVKDTTTPTGYVSVPYSEGTKALGGFIGDYSLQRDDFYELFYIERR